MRISINFDDSPIRDVLNRLLTAGHNMTPLMQSIGEHLVNTTRERFRDEEDPSGKPWAPLSETTRRRKQRNKDRILTEYGYLGGASIHARPGRDYVEVGSTRIYAGTHQFGAAQGAYGATSGGAPIPWGDIPARPFLGLSDEDNRTIQELVTDYLEQI